MKSIKPLPFILIVLLLCSSCEKNNPPVFGSISGTVTDGLRGGPVSDLLIYVLDRDQEIDTINYENDQIIVDSLRTDASGHFLFDSLPAGSYSLAPYARNYMLKLKDTTQSLDFDIVNGENYEINFDAAPNLMSSFFDVKITLKNAQGKEFDDQYISYVIVRRQWVLWLPMGEMYVTSGQLDHSSSNNYVINFRPQYGSTSLLYTMDNYFRINATIHANNENFRFARIFSIYTPLDSTPAYIEWEYDCVTQEVKRIE